jgi:TolA-binding protein
MKRWTRMTASGALSAGFALALACDQHTHVERQTRDLQEAQKNVGKETQELESQLAKAKADVARLEQKIALARQGLTDDVLDNQKELTEALKAQGHEVQSELGEVKREAEIHGRDTEAALKQLGQTGAAAASSEAPPPVDPAQPAQMPPDNPDQNELVPVKGGPDPAPEGAVDIEPGTPEPTRPRAITPNDPPAPVPAPPVPAPSAPLPSAPLPSAPAAPAPP